MPSTSRRRTRPRKASCSAAGNWSAACWNAGPAARRTRGPARPSSEYRACPRRTGTSLEAAVGKWLDEGDDGPAALHAAIEREAAHRRSGKVADSITVNVHGEGSAGFGYVHNLGGLHLGGRPRGETAGEPETRR